MAFTWILTGCWKKQCSVFDAGSIFEAHYGHTRANLRDLNVQHYIPLLYQIASISTIPFRIKVRNHDRIVKNSPSLRNTTILFDFRLPLSFRESVSSSSESGSHSDVTLGSERSGGHSKHTRTDARRGSEEGETHFLTQAPELHSRCEARKERL